MIQVKLRDGHKCVISGNGGVVEACHIVPFAVTRTNRLVDAQASYWSIVDNIFGKALSKKLRDLFKDVGSADATWNMICMNPYLHRLFDQGNFGLKPISLKEADGNWKLTFQIFWFEETASRPSEASGIKVRDMFIRSGANQFQNVVEHRATNNLVIQSGDEFHIIISQKADAEKMLEAFRLRWAVGEICAMAGGAGRPYDDSTYKDDEDQTGEHAS